MVLDRLEHPIVQAPMGGGPSTPSLAAAVAEAGGLGFLAAGYKSVDAVRADVEALRALTGRPFGVNLFAPPSPAADDVGPFAARLQAEAERYGAPVGEPRHDDDGWEAKLALMAELEVPVVSFTFGCPSPAEAPGAGRDLGDGDDAGRGARGGRGGRGRARGAGRRGGRAPRDLRRRRRPARSACSRCSSSCAPTVDLPLVATGGIATGRGVAAVLVAGAAAAQLGTAFMLCDEAATAPAHREAIAADGDTALTRAFTGRSARGIVNRWMREHEADAPQRLPRRAPPDGEDPRRRARAGGRGRLPPVGRAGPRDSPSRARPATWSGAWPPTRASRYARSAADTRREGMTMRGLGKAVTIAMAGSAALAGTAQAQSLTIAPVKPCYLAGEKITTTIAGFTPGGLVDFTLDGTPLGPLAPTRRAAPWAPITLGGMRGVKSHGLTATDQTNPALVASVAFLGTTRQVVVKPTNARPAPSDASRATASWPARTSTCTSAATDTARTSASPSRAARAARSPRAR